MPKIILFLFLSIITFPSIALANAEKGLLKPCINILTGSYSFNEYHYFLREIILNQSVPKDSEKIARFIVNSAFQEEEYLAIYQNSEQEYILEYIKPQFKIWTAIQNAKEPIEHREKNVPKVDEIKTTTSRKKISPKMANTILDVWSVMTRKTELLPEKNSRILHGTVFHFTYGTVQCGISISGVEGEDVATLVTIGDEMIKYANSNNEPTERENKIINLADSLLLKEGKKR